MMPEKQAVLPDALLQRADGYDAGALQRETAICRPAPDLDPTDREPPPTASGR